MRLGVSAGAFTFEQSCRTRVDHAHTHTSACAQRRHDRSKTKHGYTNISCAAGQVDERAGFRSFWRERAVAAAVVVLGAVQNVRARAHTHSLTHTHFAYAVHYVD